MILYFIKTISSVQNSIVMESLFSTSNELVHLDIIIMFRIFFSFEISTIFLISLLLFFSYVGFVSFGWTYFSLNQFKNVCLIFVITSSLYIFFLFMYVTIFWLNSFKLHSELHFDHSVELFFKNITVSLVSDDLWCSSLFSITLSRYNSCFLLLFSVLYPVIFILMSSDYNNVNYKFYLFMYLVYFLSYVLLLTNNIIVFYFTYELILILVFGAMYISSNSRGGIEAALFFAGWAVLGSILVSLGFILLIISCDSYLFTEMDWNKLTSHESYCIYLLFFFGFGSKLSTWPLWYWLPKAHVEVSTSMSIFLSCILIKLSFFCLIKIKYLLVTEYPLNLCLGVILLSAFDITWRLMNLKDLKAVVAYSSVLHTNLLLLLVHLDSFQILNNSVMYIWGHSLATACIFLSVNLIESMYGTRSILQISGLLWIAPDVALMTFWSLISFLSLPITLFFWGELWLWVLTINKLTITGTQILVLAGVIFLVIFFKIWWNVLYGVPMKLEKVNDSNFTHQKLLILWLLFLQYLIGLIPMILISSTGYNS